MDSQGDLCNALFHAGFSTRDYINQFSGRGVGMAALKKPVVSWGEGSIELEDWSGTTISFRFPRQQFCLRRLRTNPLFTDRSMNLFFKTNEVLVCRPYLGDSQLG